MLDSLPVMVLVFDDVVGQALERVVRRRRWNLRAALELFDHGLVAYLARKGAG